MEIKNLETHPPLIKYNYKIITIKVTADASSGFNLSLTWDVEIILQM